MNPAPPEPTPSSFNPERFWTLLDEDHFNAIRLLYNAEHYVSATKLLLSFIDTLAYLEFGDTRDAFKKWLHAYAALTELHLTPEELWELRNALLHLTSLESRKVRAGAVSRLVPYVAHPQRGVKSPYPGAKLVNLSLLLPLIAQAAQAFCTAACSDPSHFLEVERRHTEILSDARYLDDPPAL
jgi:hypothetical protein